MKEETLQEIRELADKLYLCVIRAIPQPVAHPVILTPRQFLVAVCALRLLRLELIHAQAQPGAGPTDHDLADEHMPIEYIKLLDQ